MRAGLVLALFGILVPASGRADWLDGIWDPQDTEHPSITVHAEHGVSVTLPAEALTNAMASGLSTEQAVTIFLARYGPKLCTDIIDFGVPHANLKVKLRLMRAVQANTHDETSSEAEDLTIDYAPLAPARCNRARDGKLLSSR